MSTDTDLDGFQFTDARELGVCGRAFDDTARFYARLPARAEGKVPEPVWNLAQKAAGLYVDFETDTTDLAAELVIEGDGGASNPNSNIDVYANDGHRWGWVGRLKQFDAAGGKSMICRGLPEGSNRFRVYLPHAGMVASLKIGVQDGASLKGAPADPRKPICIYGTSIIHGFSASRSGMTLPAQLGRRLDYPVWNLGFSGNARMEMALAELLAELDPLIYVLDPLPNMGPDLVTERHVPFVKHLRAARPQTPIVLVENIVYQATYMLKDKRGGWGDKNDALKKQFQRLQHDGVSGLYYLNGEQLLGSDGEATADGTHPSDLGFLRMTDTYEAALRPLMG